MTWPQTATRGFLLAITGLLTACIDIREEYWFQGNGSGRADITYSLSAVAARLHGGEPAIRRMLAGFLADTPAITSSSYQVVTGRARTQVRLQFGFDSAQRLQELAVAPSLKHLPAAAAQLLGMIQVGRRGRTVDFSRVILPAKALPEVAFLPASQFAGHRLVYLMHLPAAATNSNATGVFDHGRTLVWDIPLEQALQAPVVTRFNMPIPVPWPLVSAIALPLGLAGGFVFLILRRARGRRARASAHNPG